MSVGQTDLLSMHSQQTGIQRIIFDGLTIPSILVDEPVFSPQIVDQTCEFKILHHVAMSMYTIQGTVLTFRKSVAGLILARSWCDLFTAISRNVRMDSSETVEFTNPYRILLPPGGHTSLQAYPTPNRLLILPHFLRVTLSPRIQSNTLLIVPSF